MTDGTYASVLVLWVTAEPFVAPVQSPDSHLVEAKEVSDALNFGLASEARSRISTVNREPSTANGEPLSREFLLNGTFYCVNHGV
jgi:hypothetical protein